MAFFENTRKPTGFGGRLMVAMMNIGHRALADWGLRFLPLAENANVLDCGCGGGANLRLMLKKCPTGKVCGIDYSPVSVEKSRKLNQTAVSAGRCEVLQASVQALPLMTRSLTWQQHSRRCISGATCPRASVKLGAC